MRANREDVNTDCGWGKLRAPCCQKLANAKMVLICVALAQIVQGMVVNGFINVGLTSIEKRFNLPSRDAGLIASTYDIATVAVLLPVGYFGGQGSKPRWIGFGMLILAVGSFVYSLPHFLTGKYSYNEGGADEYCGAAVNSSSASCGDEESLSSYKYVLLLGQALHGLGAAPLYTLGLVFLDENLTPENSAFYLGIMFMLATIGPAIGYLMGGYFVGLYTDFDTVDVDKLEIDEESEAWVGAWWVGPLICSVLSIIVAIPILGFPGRLPGWEKLEGLKSAEVHKGAEEVIPKHTGIKSLRDFPKSFKVLITNLTFIFLSLAGACDAFLITGFSTFSPKYVETQFTVPASTASLIVGAIVIVMAASGAFLGGLIIKKARLTVPGILRFCIVISATVCIAALILLVQCQQQDFAGVSVDYSGKKYSSFSSKENEDLEATCNSNCSCAFDNYSPVCGDNDVTYLNPCAAGCLTEAQDEVYGNCSCLGHGEAKEGVCDSGCDLLYVFIPLFALLNFLTFLTYVPIVPATIRCVPEAQRSLALSLQDMIIRPLGSIPGPIVFGALMDTSCLFWLTPSCGDSAACYYYDNRKMALVLMGVSIAVKVVTTISFTLALVVYKAPPKATSQVMHENGGFVGDNTHTDSARKYSIGDAGTPGSSADQRT